MRNFTYDSLGRLLTAQNPESGAITYAYDADGNLLQKTSPAPTRPVRLRRRSAIVMTR
ncbi:MAG TPA: RHS repeat domain-containing protein [Candidatus Angelobacter sp.]